MNTMINTDQHLNIFVLALISSGDRQTGNTEEVGQGPGCHFGRQLDIFMSV